VKVAVALVGHVAYPTNLALTVTVYAFASAEILEAPKMTFFVETKLAVVGAVESRLIRLAVVLAGL
jgi:hypothetical protein